MGPLRFSPHAAVLFSTLLMTMALAGCAVEPPPMVDDADPPPGGETAPAQPDLPRDEAEVLAVVQGFLDALAAHDSELMTRVLLPGGSVHAVEMRPDRPQGEFRSRTGAEDIASLDTPGAAMVERIRDPEILVAGRVAVVWAPYDFWLGEAWSHCGTDAFTLLRSPEGWVITSISYTVETEGCAPAPLDG